MYIRAEWVFAIVNQQIKSARILHDCAHLHYCTNFDGDSTIGARIYAPIVRI